MSQRKPTDNGVHLDVGVSYSKIGNLSKQQQQQQQQQIIIVSVPKRKIKYRSFYPIP